MALIKCCCFYIGDLEIPAPDDYVAVSEVFTFSMTVDRQCVNVTLIEDDILENPENLLLDLDTDDPMVILLPQQAEVIINDTSRKYIIIGEITLGLVLLRKYSYSGGQWSSDGLQTMKVLLFILSCVNYDFRFSLMFFLYQVLQLL